MHPSFLGGAAALLALALWWAGRRTPRPLLRCTDGAAIAALNRAQIAALQPPVAPQAPSAAGAPGTSPPEPAPAPATPAERVLLLRRLAAALGQDPATRLAAVSQARAWGHRCTVPLLRRGLRDADPAVVREAVLAMERFRGRTAAPDPQVAPPQRALPRNVSRTR
jgi:hypothetical protein